MADIKVSCSHCGQHIQCEEGYRGLQVQCPACRQSFLIPPAEPPPSVHITPRAEVPPAVPRATLTAKPRSATHQLQKFPVVVLILLHYLTLGLFPFIWVSLQHGKLPRVRPDDPSAGKAIGFCFIPFFNFYWIFFVARRLCRRIDDQRLLYGLAPSKLTGLATITCVFQLIPLINLFLGFTILYPIFIGLLQRSINQLADQTALTGPQSKPGTRTPPRAVPVWVILLIVCAALVGPGMLAGFIISTIAAVKQNAEVAVCVNHERQLMQALRTYASVHNSQLPETEGWCDAIKNNVGGEVKIFECPITAGSKRCGFAFNRQLTGAEWRRINPATVVLFESDQGWNASGGKELIPAQPHHRVLVVGFADGSVQMIQPSQIGLLRWNP